MLQDSCHPQIVRALQKAGWSIDREQVFVPTRTSRVFIDLRASYKNEDEVLQIIIAEVKCFADKDKRTTELYTSVGQYLFYRRLLAVAQMNYPLYLAVPLQAYQAVFDENVEAIVAENHVKMIIVDVEREEIVRWIE